MIPFKYFAPALVGLTGIGWVISGIVQKPDPLTIMDLVELGPSGCIRSFKKDRNGVQPFVKACNGGGNQDCCVASSLEK